MSVRFLPFRRLRGVPQRRLAEFELSAKDTESTAQQEAKAALRSVQAELDAARKEMESLRAQIKVRHCVRMFSCNEASLATISVTSTGA